MQENAAVGTRRRRVRPQGKVRNVRNVKMWKCADLKMPRSARDEGGSDRKEHSSGLTAES